MELILTSFLEYKNKRDYFGLVSRMSAQISLLRLSILTEKFDLTEDGGSFSNTTQKK